MNYAEAQGHPADFEVRYRFYTAEEGGRRTGPAWQYARSDWAYDGDDVAQTGIYMIWPEFMTEDGVVQPEGSPVPWSGLATTWILVPEMRTRVHRSRIHDGVHGYFMEGGRRTAEAIVTRLLGLHSNPDQSR